MQHNKDKAPDVPEVLNENNEEMAENKKKRLFSYQLRTTDEERQMIDRVKKKASFLCFDFSEFMIGYFQVLDIVGFQPIVELIKKARIEADNTIIPELFNNFEPITQDNT
jgi:hypothetical protein